MKRYYDRKTAPLKFHKFFRCIILPYRLLISILSFPDAVSADRTFQFSHLIGLSFNAASIICLTICIIGIWTWKPIAWKALMLDLILRIGQTAFIFMISLLFLPQQILAMLSYHVFALVTSGPILLYYIKRRPLFFPEMIDSRSVNHEDTAQPDLQGN